MSSKPHIPTPMPLLLRRLRFQLLPIASFVVSAALAGWIWSSHAHTAVGTGEVEAIRVIVDSKHDGVLEALPRPVNLFDTVKSGELVARLDTVVDETEIQRLEDELGRLEPTPTTGPSANATLEWYHTRIDHLRKLLAHKELKAPISGTIVEIHKRPGEGVFAGKPILTIAESHPTCIIGYFRADQAIRPAHGMAVQIQVRGKNGGNYLSSVLNVGSQVELLPARHWRNPQVQEWGLPVQIAIPRGMDLKPGEMVDLVIKPQS